MPPRPRQPHSSSKASERTEAAYLVEKNRIQKANAEKTARLKGLRLAKEARERELAAAAPPTSGRKPRKKAAIVKQSAPEG
jgi:hypothetical protein